jgi:hypothetical protein
VEPAFAADVEYLGLAAEHHRDDPGRAGEAAGFGCGDAASGVEGANSGRVELGEELPERHRHDHGGGLAQSCC